MSTDHFVHLYFNAVGWTVWPVKSVPKWPIICRLKNAPNVIFGGNWPTFSLTP